MTYRIQGTLKLPDGAPAANCEVEFVSRKNFSPLVQGAKTNILTSATGAYDVTLEFGEYAVILYTGGTYPSQAGTITLSADTTPGLDLPSLLNRSDWVPATPEYMQQIEAWLVSAGEYAASAEASAQSASESAASIAGAISAHEAKAGAHSIGGISGLQQALEGKETAGVAASAISTHKTESDAHAIEKITGLREELNSLAVAVPDVETLRSLSGLTVGRKVQLAGYYSDAQGVGGGVLIVTNDTTALDDGGAVFVTADGKRVKRERKLRLKASDFGVRGDWNGGTGTDNRSRIEAMIAASNSSQPWEIDLDNVGVSTIKINGKNNWKGFITGSVVNISAKPASGPTDEKDSAGGVLPTFKITNCDKWKLKGGAVDNRYREAFWVENCNKFVNECDVIGSGLNNNLRPNYYRYCRSFRLRGFRHDATSEKPAIGYYAHCNNINLWDCSNFKILDFEVEDTGSNGIYVGSNCNDFTIAQYVISGNAMSGIQLAWSSFGRFPCRGTIGAGMINSNRADGIDINNTSGSIVRIQLVIDGVQSVNNGYNDDGTVTADGSGLGTFKSVSHFDVIGCHSEDPARAGFFAYNCTNFNIVGGSIKKEKTTNNSGEGIYIESCSDWKVSGIDVAMASGKEALKLYGTLANGVIGKNTKLKGIIALPTPDATTSYTNVCFDGATISTTAEVQGRVPFKNTRIVSSSNGLRAYENVDNCDIESTAGIGLIYGASGVSVSGGRYKGTNSGTYCNALNRCALSRAKAIGGSGPASHWLSAVASQITNNQFTAGTGNALRTESTCTKTISYGNYSTGIDSLAGTFDINY